jgi:ribosomal RNA-processing protein 8
MAVQTAPKKKLKRKRDDKEEGIISTAKKGGVTQRNPFVLRDPRKSKNTMNLSSDAKPQKGSVSDVAQSHHDDDAEQLLPTEIPISKRQKARNKAERRLLRKLENSAGTTDEANVVQKTQPKPQQTTQLESIPSSKLTPLQQKMRAKLTGSQFRHINEKLYTTHSSEALSLFADQPSLFHDYHQGFRHQVQSWPTNPIDKFIALVSSAAKKRALVIADLGCGDAALAQHFHGKKSVKVRSFDLVKVNEFVQVCDMAHVPLDDATIDIAVFCLSLMGINFLAFIREACRYTKLKYYPTGG